MSIGYVVWDRDCKKKKKKEKKKKVNHEPAKEKGAWFAFGEEEF